MKKENIQNKKIEKAVGGNDVLCEEETHFSTGEKVTVNGFPINGFLENTYTGRATISEVHVSYFWHIYSYDIIPELPCHDHLNYPIDVLRDVPGRFMEHGWHPEK